MSGPIENILSQFPGPVTLKSSSSGRMMAGAVLAAISAVALSYVGIMGRGLSTGHPQPDIAGAILMFSIAALCLVGLRRAVVQLGSGSLRLDETGFELAGYRHERYLWKDVGDFRREAGGKSDGVAFRVRPPKDDPDALLNLRFMGGRDVWLPDSYGFKLEDLAQLLAGWHRRAIKE
jgi:hypothetical protein